MLPFLLHSFTDCKWNPLRCSELVSLLFLHVSHLCVYKINHNAMDPCSTKILRISKWWYLNIISLDFNLCTWRVQLMETSGTDILNDSDVRAPVSPLHLAVSNIWLLNAFAKFQPIENRCWYHYAVLFGDNLSNQAILKLTDFDCSSVPNLSHVSHLS